MQQFEIHFNGAPRLTSSRTVAELLSELALEGRRVAVELNRSIVSRTEYPQTALSPGDQVEIVHFVGGG